MPGNTFILAETAIEKQPEKLEPPGGVRQLINGFQTFQKELKCMILRKDIVWRNVIIFIYLHYAAFYGLFLALFGYCKGKTVLFGIVYLYFAVMGVTAGAHRLWSHKCYKAKWQLRALLILCNSMTFQNSVYEWVRDHRVHHKFVDTNADPHNVNRGFFFSHMGWLLVKKHPDVKVKGQTIDMSDLERDPFIMFQKKYYGYLMPFFCFMLPTMIAYYILGEPLSYAWYWTAVFRYVVQLHGTWFVNSAAHIWGWKPYDRTMKATDNLYVGIFAFGEGWHNYHHVFPWDYKTSELGDYKYNFTAMFIDFFAKIGWAYDLKTVSDDVIRKRAARTGDGTNVFSRAIDPRLAVVNQALKETDYHIWGWDDPDMLQTDKDVAKVLNEEKSL